MQNNEFREAIKNISYSANSIRKDIYSVIKDLEGLRNDLKRLDEWIDKLCLLPVFNIDSFIGETDVSFIKADETEKKE